MTLGNFEEQVLLAVQRLHPNAYGVTIMGLLEEVRGAPVALGAIYTTLERLERKGYVKSWRSAPTPERGGRSKRMFELQALGEQALAVTRQARTRLTWNPAEGMG